MTNNAMMNATINAPAKFSFKNENLNRLSVTIASIGKDMAEKNILIAKALGEVKTLDCFKDDGFKSVADYAEQTFGIKKAMAYQMANVGERFYNNDKSAISKTVSGMFTPSMLAELAPMSDDDISKAIENGTIKAGATQKELREVAKSVKGADETKVVKTYDIKATIIKIDLATGKVNETSTIEKEAIDKEHFPEAIFGDVVNNIPVLDIHGLKIDGDKSSALQHMTISAVGKNDVLSQAIVWYRPHVTKAQADKANRKNGKMKKFTKEELMAMLKALENEEEES